MLSDKAYKKPCRRVALSSRFTADFVYQIFIDIFALAENGFDFITVTENL